MKGVDYLKINIINVDDIVKANKLPEVTDPTFFDGGMSPTKGGLFSEEIFGMTGTQQRDQQFAYIDLSGHYLHPVAYKAVIALNRKIKQLIAGSDYFKLDSKGELVQDDNGKTGIEYLYEIWDKIRWKTTESNKRNSRIQMIKTLPKEEIFVTKFLVLPAGLRDYNTAKSKAGKVTDSSPVNSMYSSIIRNAQSISSTSIGFVAISTRAKIQSLLIELYDYYTGAIKGKTGMLHKGILGKTVDYSTRSVISSPKIQSETYDTQQIPFGYVGVPLSQLVVTFFPFYSFWINEFCKQHLDQIRSVGSQKNPKMIPEEVVLEQFNDYNIKKILSDYIKNIEGRFSSMMIKDSDGKSYPFSLYRKELGRNFTVTDLLFIASHEICADKHVMFSRYPIENINNILPAKIKVMSTIKTRGLIKLDDLYLENYPDVIPDYPILNEESVFIDTIVINNSYTGTLGADKYKVA